MRPFVLLLLALLCHASAAAQGVHTLVPGARPEAVGLSSVRLARIDTLIAGLVARQEIPGAVALIARYGEVAYLKVWGYRDTETRAPTTSSGSPRSPRPSPRWP